MVKQGTKMGDKGSNSINNTSVDRRSDTQIEKEDVVHKKTRQKWINCERIVAAIKNNV